MEIIAIVGFYQDRKAGQRLAENLDKLGIPSIWCDSRVEGFKQYNNSDYSTDGLPEFLQQFKSISLFRLGLTQKGEGITFMLRKAAAMGYKYTITLGCDEYLEGDFELFKSNLKRIKLSEPTKLRVPLVEKNGDQNISERVVYMPEFVHVKHVHYFYYNNYFGYEKLMAVKNGESPLVLGLTIYHDDTVRDPERNQAMDEYQKIDKKKEFETTLDLIRKNQI
jgi:hypothetical protein